MTPARVVDACKILNPAQLAEVPVSQSAADFSYVPPGRNHLFVPGPVNIHDKVQRAMAVPSANHRDAWFSPWFKSILEDTKMIFDTQHGTPFIFPGTGTGGWESALTNTLCPGDKVVTFRYGVFSHLWIDMMQRLGLDVVVIDQPWGEAADEARLDEVLRADKEKKIKAVCVVHNETSTGVTSDLAFVRKVMDDNNHPALFMVDGVSSIGALEFRYGSVATWRVFLVWANELEHAAAVEGAILLRFYCDSVAL